MNAANHHRFVSEASFVMLRRVVFGFAVLSLARCPADASVTPGLVARTSGPAYSIVYAFRGGKDGWFPESPLVADASGALYGTTRLGGATGKGTVYKLTPSASSYNESILHSFKGGNDGSGPTGAIALDAGGTIYGTTGSGGANQHGTVFAVSPSGAGYAESVLYSFTGGADGSGPVAGITRGGRGDLFGVTRSGGSTSCPYGCGVVFRITVANGRYRETTIHTFVASHGGTNPIGQLLLDPAGDLIGATEGFDGQGDMGNVFALVPSQGTYREQVLYAFPEGTSEQSVVGSFIEDAAGDLYDTGVAGSGSGFAEVLELVPAGKHDRLRVLFSVGSSSGGEFPNAPLVLDAGGSLYGTTGGEGDRSCGFPSRCGTVFSISPTATGYQYSLLHAFDGRDGSSPATGLLETGGALFGTAVAGGPYPTRCSDQSCGVVFKLTP